jgi:hypothetical protein
MDEEQSPDIDDPDPRVAVSQITVCFVAIGGALGDILPGS